MRAPRPAAAAGVDDIKASQQDPTNLTRHLAEHVANTGFDDLPQEAIHWTRNHILHTLGCLLAGSATPGIAEILALARRWGGTEEATILVYGDRLPAPNAALVNAAMAHSLEMDNNDDRIAYKTSVAVIPAALASAELGSGRKGNPPTSGRDFLTATALAIDLGIRLGLAAHPESSHAHAPTLGPMAAAAGAAKLMGLEAGEIFDALGIAYCRSSHSASGTVSPSLTKRLGAGLAAQAGTFAAQLAAQGFPSGADVLKGKSGLYQKFYGPEGNWERLFEELGQRYQQVGVGPKPYPSCRYTHAAIEAVLTLREEHKLQPEDVEEIGVTVGSRDHQVVVGTSEELQRKKRRPEGVVDAQFGLPYTVAVTLIKGRPLPCHFTEEAIREEMVLALADRVRIQVDSKLDAWPANVKPQIVEARTRDGQTFRKRIDYPRGNSQNPVQDSELNELFLGLVEQSPNSRIAQQGSTLQAMFNGLESVEDMGQVVRALT